MSSKAMNIKEGVLATCLYFGQKRSQRRHVEPFTNVWQTKNRKVWEDYNYLTFFYLHI